MRYKTHKSLQDQGFTLIELLISIALIITAGTAVVGILASSLRGSNKVGSSESVRQSANGALIQMSKLIQYADSFEGVSNDDFNTTTTSCLVQASYQGIKVKSNGVVRTIACQNLTIDNQPLINTTKIVVSPGTCSFVCRQSSLVDPPVITISFTLKQATDLSSERNATFSATTTVKMRNLNQ